ncbi:MAG: SRPBCC family protein [Woeseiaceae bacterium]|nr:SRPBCC family protein [Woeseiaceae bacterium]
MERATEIQLANELLELHARKSAFLNEAATTSPVEIYFDPERFKAERDSILRTAPQPIVHSSELPEPGSFLRRDFAGLPVLFTRDADGAAHAFLNVCRHRGTRLVDDQNGCKQRFSCPYHAWTWNNRGELVGVPHEKQGFPELDRGAMGLKRLGSVEKYGWIWAWASGEEAPNVDDYLAGLAGDLERFDAGQYQLVHMDEEVCSANWKILVEGGIEAYHFRVAHRDTIAPHFLDNLSSYESFGPHMRSIMAKRSLAELPEQPVDDWRLRDHAQVLYSIFPINQFLVQSDHFAWIQLEPISATSTRIRLSTLAPSDRVESDDDMAHWAKNHAITSKTLAEDFDIGESIQAGLESGANEHLNFGRFEGALADFNRHVDSRLNGG